MASMFSLGLYCFAQHMHALAFSRVGAVRTIGRCPYGREI